MIRVVLNTFPIKEGTPWGITWLVDAPEMHPIWSQYVINLYDLTTLVPGKPVHPLLVGATHELLCWAADPNYVLDLDKHVSEQKPHWLQPPNFGYQFKAANDEAAEKRVQALMNRVAVGELSLDTDYRSIWDKEFADAGALVTSSFGTPPRKEQH